MIAWGLASGRLNPMVRYQAYVYVTDLLPKQVKGFCACGCGQPLPTRRRRWASDECQQQTLDAYWIIKGETDIIARYVAAQHGEACAYCGVMGEALQVDHILPVAMGGGACWLDNYQLLCVACHKVKSRTDLRLIRAA